ncbi:MAG: ABC-type Fe3+ transport system substrate-binding protein [Alphaproteobacteria bacterium]|jgi:ABC-type Fe3+ transport system substrate-binding protein
MKLKLHHTLVAALAFGVPAAGLASLATAADLPKATQKMIKELKLGSKYTAGINKEAEMPAGWVAKAKKEKILRIAGTWDELQFAKMIKPFEERWPFLDIKYSRATRHDRVIKPLMAYQAGRITADVISGVGAKYSLFKKLKANADMSVVPNWKNVPKGMKAEDGGWVGQRLRYWCMSYNTNNVKKSELPKKWDDLITNKRWHNKKIGMGNRPNLWLIMLWGANGEDWAKAYARDIFATLKPQLRKEGMNALIGLTIAGEFDASIPSAAYRTYQQTLKGAPVGWHCPEPVPLSVSEMVLIRGSDRKFRARIFLNWFLSREGQIAQYYSNFAPPVHKDLQTKDFLQFPEAIVGKKIAFRYPELVENEQPKLMKYWDPLWLSGRGIKMVTVTVKIGVKRGGRRLIVKNGGKDHTVKISGSRSKITIAGLPSRRSKLKAGMTCAVTYPGKHNEEAKKVDCK